MSVPQPSWPPGSSRMAKRVRTFDWTQTPLGSTDIWSPELKAATMLVLDSAFPAALIWGDNLTTIYNDAFAAILGDKPDALGRSFAAIWAEAWTEIGPIVHKVLGGEPTYVENFPLTIDRFARSDPAYFTFAYSPVRRADGRVVGMIEIVTETTDAMTARSALEQKQRLQTFVLSLTDAFQPLADPATIAGIACRRLVEHLGVYRAFYWLAEDDVDAEPGRPLADHVAGLRLAAPADIAETLGDPAMAALRAGDTLTIGDTSDDPRFGDVQRAAFAALGVRSAMIVPVETDGRLCATLTVCDGGRRVWTADDVIVAKETARRASDAIDRAKAAAVRRESEARHRLLIGSWAQAVWETDGEGVVAADSPSWRAYTGQTLEEWLGYGWLSAIHPDDRAFAGRQWREAIAARGLVNAEFRLRAPDGGWRWTNVRAAPVLDAEGRIEKWAGMNIDIQDNRLAREAREKSERFSRALIEGVPQLIWRAVDGGDWTWASPQWTAYTGQPEAESRGHGWLAPVHPDDRADAMMFWHRAEATGHLEMDGRIRHAATGQYRWFQTRATPVRGADGTIVEWLGTSTDVDDLRRLRDRQQLLVAELQHRVRNILTVVRSVFDRTAEAGSPLEQVVDHFRGRLDNLARTQVVVTQSTSGAVNLRNLIFDELLSVGFAESPKVTLAGPDVRLDPTTAESISLAVHELTTNAVKYGALKIAGATLSVRWRIEAVDPQRSTLVLVWTEDGVPAVPLRPARQGFGSELIEEALPYRLGAKTKLEFRGGGIG